MQKLCEILIATGVPANVLADTITTVAEAIQGNQLSQEFLMLQQAPFQPPRPLVVVLLMSMIGEHQPLGLRTSILYFFQAIYLKNTAAQSKLVQTLLPQQGNKGVGISTGQLLCSGFFSTESASARWLSAVALSHGIAGNLQQKEQLLRVQLATSVGNPPISLLKRTSQDLMTISREGKFYCLNITKMSWYGVDIFDQIILYFLLQE